jgi:hypothetical protein
VGLTCLFAWRVGGLVDLVGWLRLSLCLVVLLLSPRDK